MKVIFNKNIAKIYHTHISVVDAELIFEKIGAQKVVDRQKTRTNKSTEFEFK